MTVDLGPIGTFHENPQDCSAMPISVLRHVSTELGGLRFSGGGAVQKRSSGHPVPHEISAQRRQAGAEGHRRQDGVFCTVLTPPRILTS